MNLKIPISIMRLCIMMLFSILTQTTFAASNIDTINKYAWSTNTGWVNFNDANGGATIYSDHLEGYAWASNIGWIRLGTYTGGGTHTYANTSQTDYGINHDGAGNLSGYAWSSNVGWLNFNPTHSQVTVNLVIGDFDDYAYTGNVGWIHFQNANPAYKVVYDATPAAPTNLIANAGSENQIDLTWIDNSTNETGFKIEQNGTLITTIAANTTSYSNTELSCDADYSYTVIATNGSLDSIPATATKTLNCIIPSYELTVESSSGGTITGEGISCGSDCTQYLLEDTQITLTATPYTNYIFDNWEGACDETGTVVINSDTSCTANFLREYTLTLNTTGEGIIENCGTDCTQTYIDGNTVSLNPIPADSWNLNSWIGDCDNTGQVLIDSDKSCTATFFQESRLNVTSQNGTVTGDGIDCGTACTQTYPPNTSVTLTAIPEADFIFTGWTGDCVGTEPSTTLTLEINKSCRAIFEPPCPDTQRLYVNQTASGTQTGCEWPNAFNDLQTALQLIAEGTLTSVTEIWIAKGTYKPTNGLERTATFQLLNGIAIYGGFAGIETQLLERNATLNKTILSGDIGIVGDNSDNSYHVITGSNTQATTILNGFTLSNGNANQGTNCPNACGGGILNINGNPTLQYLVFTDNHAELGGAIANLNQSSPNLNHLIFNRNSATQTGAAMHNQNSQPLITHSIFSGNSAPNGSSIANTNSSPLINNSILWNNSTTISIADESQSQTTVNFSIIQGGWTGNGSDNRNDAPLFVTDDDFHLQAVSPAIDAGNNDLTAASTDFDGQPRLQDGDGDGITLVDLGVYEAPALILPNYPLTVTLTGEGSGTVNSNKAGITCGTDCSQDYQSGLQVLLMAQADAGSSFSGWNSACRGTEDEVMVEMTSAKTCEAQFDIASKRRVSLSGITLICEDCNINDAALAAPEAQPVEPGHYDFPQGLVSFELTELENPSAHLDIYYHNINQLDNFVYRKYGPTISGDATSADWYTLPNVTIVLDTLDGKTVVKATLTLTDGALGDSTGIDRRIVDQGGIAKEEPLPSITQEEIPVISIEQEMSARCKVVDGVATGTCNVEQQIFPDAINIGPIASISHAIFETNVESTGLISNSTIGSEATLTGGTLTGTITNEGTIKDIKFVGAKLSGGILSGTITNASEIGGVIENVQLTSGTILIGGNVRGTINAAPDSILQNVQLAAGTRLSGGILSGEITGDPNNPPLITTAEIAHGAVLSNVRISPSVELPDDVVLGHGVILPSEPPTLEDFGLEEADLANLDAEALSKLEPAVFAVIIPEQLEIIPPEAFESLKSEQIAEIQKNTLGAMTVAQFNHVPNQALSGLTSVNMGGFSTAVLDNFTPEHLSALQSQEFKQMSSQDISKFFTNFNAEKIDRGNVLQLIPDGWQIDANTGAITAPEGAKLTPRTLPASSNVPAAVKLPQTADISKGMGLGGQATPIKDNMKHALEEENLTDFELSQNKETGILLVKGTGDSKGINYSFIPDIDNVIQVDGDKIPIGLAVTEGGFYTITTPDEKQYKVIPAPQDPIALSKILGGGEVVIGKRGDVLMEIKTLTRQRGEARLAAIFEPFIEPAPEDICVEITPEEVVCDFDNAPDFMKPGLHLPFDRVRQLEKAKVIYPDGTAQSIMPTLLSPDVFIEEGFKIEGVEDIVFNSNGIFYVLHKGNGYLVIPNFKVETQPSIDEETLEPSIVINEGKSLTYRIAIESQIDSRTRNRSDARLILIFEPMIEPAPEDMCVEIMPKEIVCDFDKFPERF
jgi:hypothetical protein